MPATPCCPDGYLYVGTDGNYTDLTTGVTHIVNSSFSTPTYDAVLGKCAQFLNHGFAQSPVESIPCGCCPVGYSPANTQGYIFLATGASFLVGAYAANKCVNLADFKDVLDGGDCPCCPEGYVYYSPTGRCMQITNVGTRGMTNTIPCVTCECDVVIEPQECVSCTESQGLPISFSFDATVKQCLTCETIGEPCYPGGAPRLVAMNLLDPIINFRLRS